MPKNKNTQYSETTYIKTKDTYAKSFGFLKAFLFSGVCLTLVVFLAILCSNLLTVGKFSFVFNKSDNEVYLDKQTLYAVMMGEYVTENEANGVGNGAGTVGAAGYIMKIDNKFYVVGNVYRKENDAIKVKDAISASSKYKAFVKNLDFNKINIKYLDYTKEQKNVVRESLIFYDKLINKIYNYIIQIDKSETTYTRVSSEVNLLKSDAKIFSSKLDAINSTNVNEKTIIIKNSYVMLIDILDNLILNLISSKNANHLTKYAYCEIIQIKYNLVKSL